MTTGDFVWCDLSAFEADKAKDFYGRLLGWHYQDIAAPGRASYFVAYALDGEIAGLYTMPETFRNMGLPSFWMPYIAVDDIEGTVARARTHGGKVELGPQRVDWGGSIALIRDPLGAGFTVYEGDALGPRRRTTRPGHVTWIELHLSDAQAVIAFYTDLFGWHVSQDSAASRRWTVFNAKGQGVSAIQEQSDERRGGYQYWGVYFAVRALTEAKKQLDASGGTVLAEEQTAQGAIVAAQDPDGAAFFLVQPT